MNEILKTQAFDCMTLWQSDGARRRRTCAILATLFANDVDVLLKIWTNASLYFLQRCGYSRTSCQAAIATSYLVESKAFAQWLLHESSWRKEGSRWFGD